ncbi:cytochrome P450 [Dissophora ornata]|nr:cytochrome P450 [Dissophora ornata]
MMSDALGDGIFTADGAKWKFQRQLAVSIFSVKAFREFTGNIFVLEGKKVIDILGKVADDGTVIDIQDLLLQYTLDVFGTVSFGKSFGCLNGIDQVAPFAEAIDDLLEISARRINDPIWKIRERFNGTTEKIASDKKMIHDYAQNIIDKRRREGYHAEKKDLLQMFMSGKDDLGESLSDNLIIDNIVTFTAGGRDSTAHALTWMFYLLLRDGTDADIMENLVREADDVLEGQDPTYDTYKKQKYTEACFNEALRIYPVAPRNLRHCEVDDILPDGTKVYAGEWVAWSSYVMGRSELVWGADAKEYKPSRWMNTEKPPASKFNSFLLGPRVCIGQQFATIEALTIIGMILQKFNLELEDPSRVPTYRPSMAFPMAGGLNIRVSWRT